jgi:hypothetical protein|tara:strand:+ start:1059 stop:1496 length:438 start_codon:yes stop_codon:yes gene_type:complete
MEYDGINTSPSLRTDTLTQLILDWDANDPSNPYMTIKEVIDEWEWDINSDNGETEQELVSMLYEKHQYEWNDGYKRGKAFLRLNEINYEIINAIEDLYIYTEWEQGDYLNKNTLEDKLDIIYYFQAKEKLQEALDEHEIENADWG